MHFNCPHCGRGIKCSDTLAGRSGQCPGCRRTFTIPAATAQDVIRASTAACDSHSSVVSETAEIPKGNHNDGVSEIPGSPAKGGSQGNSRCVIAPSPPRLSIFHLLLGTLCSAAYLALSRFFFNTGLFFGMAVLPNRQATDVLNSLVIFAVLTGASTLVWARYHGGSWRATLRHPGHWLLCGQAVTIIIHLLLATMAAVKQTWNTDVLAHGTFLYLPLAELPAVAVYGLAMARTTARSWKWVFIALMARRILLAVVLQTRLIFIFARVQASYPAMALFFFAVCSWIEPVVVVCLIILSMRDLRTRYQRDWLHWFGVALYVFTVCVTELWNILSPFTGRQLI